MSGKVAASTPGAPWVWFTCALAIVILVCLPVHAANPFWDDKFYLYDHAWLRQGNQWMQFVFHGIPDWDGTHFRSLGVALFTAATRRFHAAPGPMHLASLGSHLINMLLVALFVRKLMAGTSARPRVGTSSSTRL